MAQEVFITGATGFLGRRLLAKLLRQTDWPFHVLVRSQYAQDLLTHHVPVTLQGHLRFVGRDKGLHVTLNETAISWACSAYPQHSTLSTT